LHKEDKEFQYEKEDGILPPFQKIPAEQRTRKGGEKKGTKGIPATGPRRRKKKKERGDAHFISCWRRAPNATGRKGKKGGGVEGLSLRQERGKEKPGKNLKL